MSTDNRRHCEVDFHSNEFAKNPYPALSQLREKYPVYRIDETTYALSRYDDVRFVLQHHELFSVDWGSESLVDPQWLPEECKRSAFFGNKNEPALSKYTSIVGPVFAGRSIRALIPLMQKEARRLIALIRQYGDLEFDFISSFSYPFASVVFSPLTGLKLDTEESISDARRWIELIKSPIPSKLKLPDERAAFEALVTNQNRQFDSLIEARRTCPLNDAATVLAHGEIDGNLVPNKELRGAFHELLIAGLSVAMQLPTAILLLSEQPELFRSLKSNPEKIPAFTEELLRFDNMVQSLIRITNTDINFHNTKIPAGSKLMLLIAAANRDGSQFSAPDQFILYRSNIRSHIGFGHGAHVCLGAALTRWQMKVALEEIITTFDTIICRPSTELDWVYSGVTRSSRNLPVRLQ